MFKAIIIDDHPDVANALKYKIEANLKGVEIVHVINDYDRGVNICNQEQFDILFLDIELGAKTGFELLKNLKNNDFHLVITTSHSNYAIQAVKFSAIDFLLKPINEDELKETFEKIKDKHLDKNSLKLQLKHLFQFITNDSVKKKRIILKTQESIAIIKIKDIIRCESDANYTIFYLKDSSKKIVSKPLKEYDELLTDTGFFRTHKSHLINIEHFLSYEKRDGGYIKMSDNSSVPVSTRKKNILLSMLDSI